MPVGTSGRQNAQVPELGSALRRLITSMVRCHTLRHGGYLIRLPVLGPDDGGLANRPAPLALLLVLVLVGLFPADVGLACIELATRARRRQCMVLNLKWS